MAAAAAMRRAATTATMKLRMSFLPEPLCSTFSTKRGGSGSGAGLGPLGVEHANHDVVLSVHDQDLAARTHEGRAAQAAEFLRQGLRDLAQGFERHAGWDLRADDGEAIAGRGCRWCLALRGKLAGDELQLIGAQGLEPVAGN